jgi:hypothetical protein
MEVFLNLTPLDLLIMAEVGWQSTGCTYLSDHLILKRNQGCYPPGKMSNPIFDMRSDHTIPIYHNSRIFKVIIDCDYWRIKTHRSLSLNQEWGLGFFFLH